MKSLKEYILSETVLKTTGLQGARHAGKYIEPYVNTNTKLTLHSNHEDLPAGHQFHAIGQTLVDGKHYTIGKSNGREYTILNSKIKKTGAVNKGSAGFSKELQLAEALKKDGLMDPNHNVAGSTGGNDFHILKSNGEKLGGSEKQNINHEDQIQGESKINLGAKFGAIALAHNKEKGWHIPDSNVKKENFRKSVENATVNGKPFLQHLNDHWGAPTDENGVAKHLPNVTSDSEDSAPAQAYFKDHHADVLHIHTHGTYRVGHSHDEDTHNTQLPKLKMSGRFTVGRERAGGNVHVAFRPHKNSVEKSGVDLMKQEDRLKFRDNLHKKVVSDMIQSRKTKPKPLRKTLSKALSPNVNVQKLAARAALKKKERNIGNDGSFGGYKF